MYKVLDFRYTQSGWVADVKHDKAALPVSIPLDNVNARDADNFSDAYQALKMVPYDVPFGYVYEVAQ